MRPDVMIARIRCLITALAAMVASTVALDATAHEIPADVRLNAFVKPAGDRLELLIRVPMAALVEVEFPLRGPAISTWSRVNEALHSATKLYLTDNITLYEDDVPLPAPRVVAVRVSLPSDKSFASFDSAHASCAGAAARRRSRSRLESAIPRRAARISDPVGSLRLREQCRVDRFGRAVSTALRFILPGGETRAFEFHGDPGLLRLDPRWHQAALRFVVAGFWHILEGIDHLLFCFAS